MLLAKSSSWGSLGGLGGVVLSGLGRDFVGFFLWEEGGMKDLGPPRGGGRVRSRA